MNFFNITPLSIAIEKGNIEIVKLLLSSEKVNVNLSSILIIYFHIVLLFEFYYVFKNFFVENEIYEINNFNIIIKSLFNEVSKSVI